MAYPRIAPIHILAPYERSYWSNLLKLIKTFCVLETNASVETHNPFLTILPQEYYTEDLPKITKWFVGMSRALSFSAALLVDQVVATLLRVILVHKDKTPVRFCV